MEKKWKIDTQYTHNEGNISLLCEKIHTENTEKKEKKENKSNTCRNKHSWHFPSHPNHKKNISRRHAWSFPISSRLPNSSYLSSSFFHARLFLHAPLHSPPPRLFQTPSRSQQRCRQMHRRLPHTIVRAPPDTTQSCWRPRAPSPWAGMVRGCSAHSIFPNLPRRSMGGFWCRPCPHACCPDGASDPPVTNMAKCEMGQVSEHEKEW